MMKRYILLILCLGFFLFSSDEVRADFTIEVTPEDNSQALNLTSFGTIRYGEEITYTAKVKITSDDEKYEVKQIMLEPLQNDKGIILDPEAVVFHTLRGSNSHGSLLSDDPVRLNGIEDILYTSSAQGNDDEFTIVYSVLGNNLNASGRFIGKIRYFVIPRGGSGTERETILNVYLNAEEKEFETAVITSSQNKRKLTLSEEDEEIKGYIKMNLEGTLGKTYNIYQIVREDFKDEKNIIMPLDAVKFSLSAKKGESNYSSFSPLEKQLLVYSSDSGTEGDEIIISFIVDKEKIRELSAGQFIAQLQYQIKADGQVKETIPMEIELEITPQFEIKVISESGVDLLYFRDLEPTDAFEQKFEKKEVVIKVESNLKKPYVVVHNLKEPLTNAKGDSIPLKFFTLQQTIDKDKPGDILFPEDTPVKLGDMNIFVSDAGGSSSEFKIVYSLRITPNLKAGDYFTSFSYSLLEK
ncbi:MAG: hypothetical protein JSV34_03055 [Candidatus Omnitrophota bacterium]|nr:MAG: hypothetical protein JSV34_03055 [Candidatus Omnitrophota bacterium]